jgi:hypothetical protein
MRRAGCAVAPHHERRGLVVGQRMAKVPKPLVGGDQAFHAAAAPEIGRGGPSREHELKGAEKCISNLEVTNVAGVVECDQDLVR